MTTSQLMGKINVSATIKKLIKCFYSKIKLKYNLHLHRRMWSALKEMKTVEEGGIL